MAHHWRGWPGKARSRLSSERGALALQKSAEMSSDMEMSDDDEYEYDEDDEDEDDDVGFADAPPVQRMETTYRPLDPEACRALATRRVDEVKELLCCDGTVAAMLLRFFRWDQEKLMEGAPRACPAPRPTPDPSVPPRRRVPPES